MDEPKAIVRTGEVPETELVSLGVDLKSVGEMSQWLQLVRSPGIDAQMGNMLAKDPSKVSELMAARNQALQTMEEFAIRNTRPQDWLVRRDQSGRMFASINSTAARRMCPALGVSVFPYFPPMIQTEGDGSVTAYQAVAAYRASTNTFIPHIEAARNSKEEFIGRGSRATDVIKEMDLKSSCAALAYRKSIESLTGIKNLSADDLERFGIDINECVKGHGFSPGERNRAPAKRASSAAAERRRTTVAPRTAGDKPAAGDKPESSPPAAANGEVLTQAASLWRECMRLVEMDREKASGLLKRICGLDDYKKFKTVKQVESANEMLIASPEWKSR
jgi:hypothetical protein